MNKIIRNEFASEIFGHYARVCNVVADDSTCRILNQEILLGKTYNGGKSSIGVSLRFDDNCGNGHETFSITGDTKRKAGNGRWMEESCGCIHEEILERFPRLGHLIKWHLTSTDGPMHYPANVLYFAGDRDCHGRCAGDASRFEHFVRFDDVPALWPVKDDLLKFLEERKGTGDFYVHPVAHRENGLTGKYQFANKFTLVGMEETWHKCPFDSEAEALAFAYALNKCKWEIVKVATAFSEGKARELHNARHAAVWPDATDAELSQEPAVLKAALEARLPALLEAFKADMLACGFIWPEHK